MHTFVKLSIALFAVGEALIHGHGDPPENAPASGPDSSRGSTAEQKEMAVAAEKLAMETSSADPLPHLTSLGSRRFDVPFFVYTGGIDWMEARIDRYGTASIHDLMTGTEQLPISSFPRKHADDFFFLKAALNHPMRTDDPSEAELFVVPGFFNIMTDGIAYIHPHRKLCANVTSKGSTTKLCNFELVDHLENMLATSEWFNRKQGKDHVVVCSGTKCEKLMQSYPLINKCNWIAFEENSMPGNRCRIASTYVGDRCDHEPKQFTFGMVATMRSELNKRHFTERMNVCMWLNSSYSSLHLLETLQNRITPPPFCGKGEQCPVLAQSRFGFHVPGDTYGSSRLIDIILSGSVPVFTHPAQYSILPPYVPWEDLSILVPVMPVTTEEEFVRSFADKVQLYDRLRGEVDKYASLVDWETPVPFEQYMWLFRQCAM
jgi:hypothetical protein